MPRWIRSETATGRVSWTCGEYVIERREYRLPVRSKTYVLRRGDEEIDRDDSLAAVKEAASRAMAG